MGDLGDVCPVDCLIKGMMIDRKREGERKEGMDEKEGVGRGRERGKEERERGGRRVGTEGERKGDRQTGCPSVIQSRL